MRKLTIILSFWLILGLTGPLVWGKPAGRSMLDQQVERQVNQAVTTQQPHRPAAKQNTNRLTERQQQIITALHRVRLKWDDPKLKEHMLSQKQFKTENESLTETYQHRVGVWNQIGQELQASMTQAITEGLKQGIAGLKETVTRVDTVQHGRPNYGQETKGIPLIYLTDASGHGTQTIINEVETVLRSVRQANPQARILLATEFGQMTEFSTPIQFVEKPNKHMEVVDVYAPIVPQANKLNIDILALDDLIVGPWEETMTLYKIGNRLLLLPIPYEEINEEKWQQIYGFVNMSTLGIKLRNEQWVSYIRAVQPFYDIIIVYAGNGHIDSDIAELDLPVQLGGNYVVFNFYTVEQNDTANLYRDNTYKMLCDANACVKIPQEPQGLNTAHDPSMWQAKKSPGEQTVEEWDGKSYIYEKTDTQAWRKIVSLLPLQEQQKMNAIQQKFNNAGFKDINPQARFDVYLPDVTQ